MTRRKNRLLWITMAIVTLILAGIVLKRWTSRGTERYYSFKQQPQSFESLKEETTSYGIAFNSSPQKVGIIFNFPDFRLVHTYFRNLTDEEAQQKRESIAAGIDGGKSMLSPFNGFEVRQFDAKIVEKFELSILPYASHVFNVNGSKFEIRNFEQGWIVKILQ